MEENDSITRKAVIAAKKQLSLARFRSRMASTWESSYLLQTTELSKLMKGRDGEIYEAPNSFEKYILTEDERTKLNTISKTFTKHTKLSSKASYLVSLMKCCFKLVTMN